MTRVFWDTNLFIYLLQAHPEYGKRVEYLRHRSLERGDELCTSALAVGEVLAGVYRDKTEEDAAAVLKGIQSTVTVFRLLLKRWICLAD